MISNDVYSNQIKREGHGHGSVVLLSVLSGESEISVSFSVPWITLSWLSSTPPSSLVLRPRPVSRSQTLGTSWLMLLLLTANVGGRERFFPNVFPNSCNSFTVTNAYTPWHLVFLTGPTPTHGVRLVKDSRYPSPARPSQNAPGRPQSARAWSEALHPSSWPSEWTASVFSHAGCNQPISCLTALSANQKESWIFWWVIYSAVCKRVRE